MAEELISVHIRGLAHTPTGAGVFLEGRGKVFSIFIDLIVAQALVLALEDAPLPRPLTHPLMVSILAGLGVELERVVIRDLKDETYLATLCLRQKSELGENVLEVDARPSDGLVLAVHTGAPVLVARSVWEQAEDMRQALERQDEEPDDERE